MRVVLLVADSLRADAPGFAGGTCKTPTLDRLASEGLRVPLAVSAAPWTVPSLSTMVTALYPHRLGLYRWEQPLPEGANLFSAFADGGHRVASFVFDPGYLFSAVPDAGVVGSSQQLDAVVDWIDGCDSPDLFVFVHYWGTHFPYLDKPMTVPQWSSLSNQVVEALRAEPEVVRPKLKGMYQLAIEKMDERFLPRLAAATARHAKGEDGWLIAVTGDHGESWGERGKVADVFDLHGNHLRDEVLRVPLVLSGPKRLRGKIRGGLVSLADLGPTLLDVAGVAPLGGKRDGHSLFAGGRQSALACSMADFVAKPQPPANPDELWTALCLRTPAHKLLWDLKSSTRQVFDLTADPNEERPLPPGSGEPAEGWAELDRAKAEMVCAPPPDLAEERLRALGYLG
ncbi:MAG TPA: sulfatase-like hydrolase/transferase [Myxococcales bacterium]|jgi:arylsulfatase A-like enzyme